MGASSSGLLDEAKISHIKGLVDETLQSFGVFYRQQYSAAYFSHLHQEVEPKKEGKGLLLAHRPSYPPEQVLYQGSVRFSCWDEQGKKCKERYSVIRRSYTVEIHENVETFNRGAAAKLVIQPVGGTVLTSEEEFRAHLEDTCALILNGVKDDSSSSVASSPDSCAVYLNLPYTGHTCFLFQHDEERGHFLSALRTCIRHQNLDPWCNSSYESQAYIRAFQLYRQDKGSYESWEMLLGTEEQVLASQVMEEVLPWLQSQLQPRLKGKKTERIRQWLATVQATYRLVLEKLTACLEALREECRQTASANQALVRSNLDQISSSHCFLEQKVRACVCDEAEKVCSEFVAPYLSSILEALTENISAGIQGMQNALHMQMDSAFRVTNAGMEETKTALSVLGSISLDQSYEKVTHLMEALKGLKQRFGLSSAQRLVHSAHLQMEQLVDSAVYTLEMFLQSSARLQPSQVPVKMDRAKERVLKQLDHDSRLVQRRLYQEALLEITRPVLSKAMDRKCKVELQELEQYIFSDYSAFILVSNVYEDVLTDILRKEIETVVQDAASKKINNLLLDTSDLVISQYSLLGQTPPRSAPGSPAVHSRGSFSALPNEGEESAPQAKREGQAGAADVQPQTEPGLDSKANLTSEQTAALLSPMIVVTQQLDEMCCFNETSKVAELRPDSQADSADAIEVKTPEPSPDSQHLSMSTCVSDECPECAETSEDVSSIQPCRLSTPPPSAENPVKTSLETLSEGIHSNSTPPCAEQTADRAIYMMGEMRDDREGQAVKMETEAEEGSEARQADDEERGAEEEETALKGDRCQTEKKEETASQSPQPMEAEHGAEQPPDSVTLIRDLVTEVVEVEISIGPCSDGSSP